MGRGVGGVGGGVGRGLGGVEGGVGRGLGGVRGGLAAMRGGVGGGLTTLQLHVTWFAQLQFWIFSSKSNPPAGHLLVPLSTPSTQNR